MIPDLHPFTIMKLFFTCPLSLIQFVTNNHSAPPIILICVVCNANDNLELDNI